MRIAMVGPRREACGVSDYTDSLVNELRPLVAVPHYVTPAEFQPEMNSDVDLVHVQHQYFLFGGVAPWRVTFPTFARMVSRPTVMTVHEIISPTGNLARKAAIRLSNRRHFLHPRIERYIVHTAHDRGRLAAIGPSQDRIAVVRLGVPPPTVLPSMAESKRAMGLEGRFVITIFGFVARKKGHLLALSALNELPQDVTLLIAGGKHPDDSTGYVALVEQEARRQGVRARITGYMSPTDVLTAMAASDLVLAPFSESSGSASLAQAFACGLPILASDIEPHREIVADIPGSMCLFGSTAAELASALEHIRRDSAAISTLREGALRYAESHSVRRAAEKTARIYREAAGT